MFFFLSGMTMFMLLEMGVTNVGGQKRIVHLFIKHPWKVEALIISLFFSFPIAIISMSFMGEDTSLLSLVATSVIAWLVLSFFVHRRFMDFQQTLGIGRKKEYDPVFVANLSIAVWTIATCGLVLSFLISIYDISQSLSYLLLGSCGTAMWFIPFRKSLKIIRNQNPASDEELE
jgi:hypothetical protein